MKEYMLTIFTVPKAFRGEFAVIQRNAVRSWARLQPTCEIFLMADDEGTREMADEVGADHVPEVERSEAGTPLLHSVFAEAAKRASFPFLCYINSDIILLGDFLPAIVEILRWNRQFLAVGQRTNLEVQAALDFSAGWEDRLREAVKTSGVLEPPNGLDYFVFPRGLWTETPPFRIGRTMWDQWIIFQARSRGVPVIDCTQRISVVHQRHGYGHHPGGKAAVCTGAEAQTNVQLAGGQHRGYTLRDATHRLTTRGIRRRLFPFDLHRCLVRPVTTHPVIQPMMRFARAWRHGSPNAAG
jgi:hypothetical protein